MPDLNSQKQTRNCLSLIRKQCRVVSNYTDVPYGRFPSNLANEKKNRTETVAIVIKSFPPFAIQLVISVYIKLCDQLANPHVSWYSCTSTQYTIIQVNWVPVKVDDT